MYSAWRSRANTRQLLRDYAAFAAWSYRQQVMEEFGTVLWATVGPIGHREPHQNPHIPDASRLPVYRSEKLAECSCGPGPVPASYFKFRLGSDSLDLVGAPLSGLTARDLIADITTTFHRGVPGREGIILPLSGAQQVLGFAPMATEWGDTIIYGFALDSAVVAGTFAKVLAEASLLPRTITGGRENAGIFAVDVRAPDGAGWYRSADWPDEAEWPFIATDTLFPKAGGFITRLTLIPQAAPALLAGGLPRTSLPLLFLVGLLGVVAAALSAGQLRRQGELARLRSDFVAGVSHELRTPLAQLRLFLDTLRLKRYDTPEEQEWLVNHLTRETTRLEHLVENILTASRLDRGMWPTALKPLVLANEVQDAVAAFAPLAASRRARMDTELIPDVTVMADQASLRQLVLNLLDNAVKFGPPGQQVRLAMARQNGAVQLTVTDQGPGVPPAERQRIWEPYYRGKGEAVSAVGGSGIGLALVHDIAESFGGSVDVTDAPGGGAAFTVSIPAADVPEGTA